MLDRPLTERFDYSWNCTSREYKGAIYRADLKKGWRLDYGGWQVKKQGGIIDGGSLDSGLDRIGTGTVSAWPGNRAT